MSTFIVFRQQNIEGGGGDTIIYGAFHDEKEAQQYAQKKVNQKTFKRWVKAQRWMAERSDASKAAYQQHIETYGQIDFLEKLSILEIKGHEKQDLGNVVPSIIANENGLQYDSSLQEMHYQEDYRKYLLHHP